MRVGHRMTRMTGPDCAVMCNLISIIDTHTHIRTQTHTVNQRETERILNGAPRVWAEKYIFCAQNTDETATRL